MLIVIDYSSTLAEGGSLRCSVWQCP